MPVAVDFADKPVMPTQTLSGKSALVTGGARRIGREIALALARAGADVTITYRASRLDATQTSKDIADLGRRAQAVECDVRSEASVRQAIAATAAFHGRLDLLVNNAANSRLGRTRSLLCLKGGPAHAHAGHGQVVCP